MGDWKPFFIQAWVSGRVIWLICPQSTSFRNFQARKILNSSTFQEINIQPLSGISMQEKFWIPALSRKSRMRRSPVLTSSSGISESARTSVKSGKHWSEPSYRDVDIAVVLGFPPPSRNWSAVGRWKQNKATEELGNHIQYFASIPHNDSFKWLNNLKLAKSVMFIMCTWNLGWIWMKEKNVMLKKIKHF